MPDTFKSPHSHTASVTDSTEIGRTSTLDPVTRRSAPPEGPPPPGPKSKNWLWLAVLVVLGIGAWIGIRSYDEAHAAAANAKPKNPPATPVVAAKAHPGDIPVYFTGLGAVTPLYTATIKTRVDGQIMKVFYTEGQVVHKEDPLVEIDPRPYEVQLTQAEGTLLRDKSLLENAQVDLTRYQTLIAKNAVAEQIYATQKSTVAQDEGNVKTDEGNIASAKLNLAYCHITAPFTGRAGLRLVDPGNLVQSAGATPLVVITQTEPMSVIFTLPEEQVPAVLKRVRAGQHLKVDAMDRDSKNVIARGDLTTLDNEIDQTTGTLKFRATYANRDETLFPNQFVNARLLLEEKKNVTLVANAAIQRSGSSTFVYLVQPKTNTVTIQNVKIGAAGVDESEITSGLSAGDVVVTQGVDKLQEGSRVQPSFQGAGAPDNAPSNAGGNAANSNGGEGNNSAPDANGGHRHKNAAGSSQDGASSTQ